MGWTYLAAALCGCACVDGSPRPLELKAADGSAPDLTWLASLEDPAVVGELQALADRDLAALDSEGATAESFVANFGPNSDLTLHPGDWTALVLQNKGRLDPAGCAAAPLTCAALSHLAHYLTPHRGEEVGVRLLKLGVNATIRPHVGPGGRLVAHLGVRVPPTGAFLTVAGERVTWREGELTVFDDSLPHSAANNGEHARYILHVAFPIPSPAAAVLSVSTPHMKLVVSGDCTVQVTNLRNGIASRVEPLLHLYNRVADNHTQNLEACVSAQQVTVNGSSMLRITAAHGYGTLDLEITAGENWLLFKLGDLSQWSADPVQKHLRVATLCPLDMCPNSTSSSPWETPIASAPFTGGRFEGFRGSEGEYPDSAGFFTISSQWQSFTTWMYAQDGEKLAYTLCPTDELPSVRAGIRAAESIAPPSPNRGRSWWWTSSSETTLDTTIATAHQMGVELLFFDGMLSNQGDFTVDLASWPSGLEAAGKRIKAAGLQVGLHMIDTGAQTCHGSHGGEPNGTQSQCAGVTVERPDIFVPQGLAPRDWFYPQTAGTWYCHEMSGSVCQDQTRIQCDSSIPLLATDPHPGGCCKVGTPGCGGHVTPPPNNIQLYGANDPSQYWCRLGRFRSGGSLCFDGKTRYGQLTHTDEYNFTVNKFYETNVTRGGGVNKSSEFSLQMVIHPVGATTGRRQVLADKPGAWRLSINRKGTVDWAVNLSGTMTVATGATVLKPHTAGVPGGYVVKATHAGGNLKVFVCALTSDFKCSMPDPDGIAQGNLPLICSTHNITFGGAMAASSTAAKATGGSGFDVGATLTDGYEGGMEEMFLYMMSLEKVNAMLFSCPNTGCVNWYVFDFTNSEARAWWANGTSRMFNQAGAVVSQWDGNEFQGSLAGWDVPHSDATLNSGAGGNYWAMAQHQAAFQSQALWAQRTAVEGGGGGGLGPWKADMAPFADEATIKGPMCGPGGDLWHEEILLRTLQSGVLLNGYHTSVTLPQADFDCFVGGLVATGIAPQLSGTGTPAQLARAKYWLDLFKTHGMATEDTIKALHYPDVFLVELQGSTSSYGLYSGNSSVQVALPATLSDNSTILTYQGDSSSCINMTMTASKNLTAATFFAANKQTLSLSGTFWAKPVAQTVTAPDGSQTKATVSGGGVFLQVQLGSYVRFVASATSEQGDGPSAN